MLASCCSPASSYLILIPAVVACWLPFPHGKALLQSLLSRPRHHNLAWDERSAESSSSGCLIIGFWWRDFADLPSRTLLLFTSPSSPLGQIGVLFLIWVQIEEWGRSTSFCGGTLQAEAGLQHHCMYRHTTRKLCSCLALSLLPYGYLVSLILRFWVESLCSPSRWEYLETLWHTHFETHPF